MPHEELPSLQRPRYGCKCAGRPGLPPLLGRRLPKERVGEGEGAGARCRGDWRAAAVRLQSWELELQRLVSGVLPLSLQIPNPQLATPTLYFADATGARGSRWVCALGQTRLGV